MIARRLVLPFLAAVPVAALVAYMAGREASAGAADDFEMLAAAIIAVCLAAGAVLAPPVYAVSGALVLTLFQNHWEALGVSIGVDRYVTLLVIASVLLREWSHRDGRLATRPVDWVLAVALIYAATSAWVVGELNSRDGRSELIDRFGLVPYMLFFIAPLVYRTEEARRVLLGTLVGIGAYLGVTAILETTGPDALIFPSYIADPAQGIHQDRARGPFLDAGANGVAMYMCAVAGVIAFVKWTHPRWRIFALVVAGLCLLGVLLTLTRAVWLGALVATPLALLLARPMRRYLFPGALAALVIVLGAFAVIPGLQDRAERRRADKQPIWDRQNSNAAAWRMLEDRPVFGFGLARFREESPPYYRQSNDYPLGETGNLHNVYLSNAVALGLVGLAIWLAALATAIGGAILRRGPPELMPWKIGLCAVTLCVMVEWATAPGRYVLPTLLLWLWAGIAWGPRRSDEGAAVHDRDAPGELQRA